MNVVTLAPCPFCGGRATLAYDSGNEVWGQSWSAGCASCGIKFIQMGSSSWASVKAEDDAARSSVIARWNTRA